MRIQFKMLLAVLLFVGGLGLQFAFYFWVKPHIFVGEVVRTRGDVPRNHTLTAADLIVGQMPKDLIPSNAIKDLKQLVGKQTNVDLPKGIVMTRELADIENLKPNESEGYFPIPKSAIYSINGSLRSRDDVDIYLIKTKQDSGNMASKEQISEPMGEPFLSGAKVIYVQNESGNVVQDTVNGNTNQRLTSTDRISNIEIKISDEQGKELRGWLEKGYQLWIVRV